MSKIRTAGFTIIETMLFLAVTGVLVMAILIGTGTSINIQRYRDSVQSLQTTLQDQYSEVVNVRNETPSESLTCDNNAVVTADPSLPSGTRGQDDCVLLGRYVRTLDDKTLAIDTVVGYVDPNIAQSSNDLAVLQQYSINTNPDFSETYEVEWGAALHQEGSENAANFSLLVVRSPLSGVVRTFINPEQSIEPRDIESLVVQANLDRSLKLCIDAGGLFGANKMAVTVVAGATSASGIEILGDGTSEC